MRLFEGVERTDYQDLLRAIGFLLDRQRARDFRLLEVEDGLLLQTWQLLPVRNDQRLRRFDDGELQELLRAAYHRRGAPPGEPGAWEGALRAVGRLLDERGWRDARLLTHEAGLLVQARPLEATAGGVEAVLLTHAELAALIATQPAPEGGELLGPGMGR